MTQALPFGEIRPGAKPLQAFIQPGKIQVAQAPQLAMLPGVKGISTQQMAGTSSVQGYNQLAQIAEALGPFNRQFSQTAQKYIVNDARTKIEDSYFDQARLENEVETAKLRWQQIQEEGAKKAAAETLYLEKKDALAAALLNETNPWKAIGRRRFVAQQAASDIEVEMTTQLATLGPQLQRMKPGSPELAQLKQEATSRVLERNGLDGSEPESAYYFNPAANKAWDNFTEKQSEMYTSALQASTSARAQGFISADAVSFMSPGAAPYQVTGPDGTLVNIERTSPAGIKLTANRITSQLDNAMSFMSTTEQRKEFMQQAVKNLGAILVGPEGRAVLQQIKTGPALTAGAREADGSAARIGGPAWQKELQNRPSLFGQYYAQLQEGNVKTLKSEEDLYELGQDRDRRGIAALWNAGPGLTRSRVDRAKQIPGFLAQVAEKFPNYADPRALVAQLNGDTNEFAQATNPLAAAAPAEYKRYLAGLPNSFFTNPENIATARNQIRDIADLAPDPEQTLKTLNEQLTTQINRAEKLQAGVGDWVNTQSYIAMDMEAVRKIKKNQQGQQGNFLESRNRGESASTAYTSFEDVRLSQAAQSFEEILTEYGVAEIDTWESENPGVALSPIKRNQLLNEALKKAQKDDRWKKTVEMLDPPKPEKPKPVDMSQQTSGVPAASAPAVTPDDAKEYKSKPIMDMEFVRSEMVHMSKNGGEVTKELQDLARKAGVNPATFLYHQLMFYGSRLDKTGEWRKFLLQVGKQTEVSSRTIQNNLVGMTRQGRVNPSAPGGWVTEMLFA